MRDHPGTPHVRMEAALLGRFTDRLFGGEDPLLAIDVLRGGLGANAAELWLLDHGNRELLLAAFCGDDQAAFTSRERFEVGLGFPGIVAGSLSAVVTEDLPHDPRFLRSLVPHQGYRSVVCLPIERSGQVAGALELAWKGELPTNAVSTVAFATRPIEAYLASASLASMRASEGSWPAGTEEPRAASPVLEIACLGGFDVALFGRSLGAEDFGRAKAIEILQLLVAAEGRGLHKDELIDALWPSVPDARAGNRFHVTMSALRHAIEPPGRGLRFVRREGDAYRLDQNAPIRVDLWDFQRLVARASASRGRFSPRERIEALETAVALYAGDLFGGRGPERCAGLSESLRNLQVDLLVELARMLVEAHTNRALLLLRRAVTIDPGREDVEQELIRALWSAGRREAAQSEYRGLLARLKGEMAVDPLPETRRLGALIAVDGPSGRAARSSRRVP
ncbi:MAG: GAF domain-containing protein [Deltaproteobacteria bacterium]|nr:GAF domain-containing protein [Deltaproteobacteria bacterium]